MDQDPGYHCFLPCLTAAIIVDLSLHVGIDESSQTAGVLTLMGESGDRADGTAYLGTNGEQVIFHGDLLMGHLGKQTGKNKTVSVWTLSKTGSLMIVIKQH